VPIRAFDEPWAIAVVIAGDVIAGDCELGPALCVDVPQAVKATALLNRAAPASILNRM
jgi:hypothetical protein